MSETTEIDAKPPYLSYTTLKNFLGQLKETGIPARIDKSLMPGQSGTTQSYLLSALRFFALIDTDGSPRQELRDLVQTLGDKDNYGGLWKPIFNQSYESILSEIDLKTATSAQLQEIIRDKFSYGGDTLRKCHTFFLNAAEDARISVGPHLKNVGRPPRKTAKRRQNNTKTQVSDDPPPPPIPEGQQKASLKLDASGNRTFSITGPNVVSQRELDRIQQWLSFQFIVEETVSPDDLE